MQQPAVSLGRLLPRRLGWLALAEAQHVEAQERFTESLTLFEGVADVIVMADSLDGFAALAAARGAAERAMRLVGAATAARASIRAPLHPIRRVRRDDWLDPLPNVVDAELVKGASAAGHALSVDQAVALAPEETEPPQWDWMSPAESLPGRRVR